METSPELKLILLAIQSNHNNQKREMLLQAEMEDIDWELFTHLAVRHRVESLVYDALNENPHIERHNLTVLLKRKERNSNRVRLMNLETAYLVKSLNEKGISLISFKGPVLSKQLYGRSDFRSAGDLDWLVEPSHLESIYREMARLGYITSRHEYNLTPRRWRHVLRNEYNFAFVHPDRRIPHEIHWNMSSNQALFPPGLTAEFITRAQSFEYGSTKMELLSNEDLLLYLCFHGSKHIWASLRWLADINEILHGAVEVDWDLFLQRAAQHKLTYCVSTAFSLARTFWGTTSVPLPWQPDRNHAWLVRKALETVTDRKARITTGGRFNGPKIMYYSYRLKKNPGVLLDFLPGSVIIADDWKYIDLPDRLFFLYALLRPILWLYKNYLRLSGRKIR